MLSNIVPSHIGSLSLQQALELTNVYLENAYRTRDPDVALVLCHDAEVALSQAKKANRKHGTHTNDTKYQELQAGVATAFIDLGKYLERRGYKSESVAICKKAEKWG
jgi:thymidylate kinase